MNQGIVRVASARAEGKENTVECVKLDILSCFAGSILLASSWGAPI